MISKISNNFNKIFKTTIVIINLNLKKVNKTKILHEI